MKTIERQKLCPHCEGRIPLEAEVCPYCSLDPNHEKSKNSFQASLFQKQSLEESLASLYKPPYLGKKPQFYEAQEAQTASLKRLSEEKYDHPMDQALADAVKKDQQAVKNDLWPIAMLSGGSHFLLLAVIQLLFGQEGKLILEFDCSFWFLYLFLGAPLLYFGFKALAKRS